MSSHCQLNGSVECFSDPEPENCLTFWLRFCYGARTETESDRGKEREREGKLGKEREFFPFFSAFRCLRKWRTAQHSADLYLNLPRSLDPIPGWFRFGMALVLINFFSCSYQILRLFSEREENVRRGKRFKIFKTKHIKVQMNSWSVGKLAQTLSLLKNPGTNRFKSTSRVRPNEH